MCFDECMDKSQYSNVQAFLKNNQHICHLKLLPPTISSAAIRIQFLAIQNPVYSEAGTEEMEKASYPEIADSFWCAW